MAKMVGILSSRARATATAIAVSVFELPHTLSTVSIVKSSIGGMVEAAMVETPALD
jgi:hypothetical protein